jgi:hypothetical protein
MPILLRGDGDGLLRLPGTDELMRAPEGNDCCCDSDCCDYEVKGYYNGVEQTLTLNGRIFEMSGNWTATGPGPGYSGTWTASIEGLFYACCDDAGPTVTFTYEWTEDTPDYSTTTGDTEVSGCTQGSTISTYTNEQVTGTDIVNYDCCGSGMAFAQMSPKGAFQVQVMQFTWECVSP